MRKSSWSQRCIAVLLSSVVLSNAALLEASEASFWSERRNRVKANTAPSAPLLARLPASVGLPPLTPSFKPLSSISSSAQAARRQLPAQNASSFDGVLNALPSADGSVKTIRLPARGHTRTIVHIQDVHMNQEAQGHIGHAVAALLASKQVDLVALEGAFTPIDLARFRAFDDQEAVLHAAHYALKKNDISGPVHAAMVSPAALPPLVGIDDVQSHRANVDAYKASAQVLPAQRARVADERRRLSAEEREVLNPALHDFHTQSNAYRDGSLPIGAYLRALSASGATLSDDVKTFLRALDIEENLSLPRVESERAALMARLVPALDAQEMKTLLERGLGFQAGAVTLGDYYATLREMCRDNGVDLARYPAMDQYVRYVLLSNYIDAESLIASVQRLEALQYGRLIRSPAERALVDRSRLLVLSEKLINFSLTNAEWDEYKALRGLEPRPSNHALSTFEDFYRAAETRDELMARNVLAAMDARGAKTAVLVTGGFHDKGLNRHFLAGRAAVIPFVPRLTKLDGPSGPESLSIFTREKTPLEKMFEGQALFLAQPPANLTPPTMYTAASAIARRPGRQPQPTLDRLVPADRGLTLSGKTTPDGLLHLTLTSPTESIENTFRVESTGEIIGDKLKAAGRRFIPEVISTVATLTLGAGLFAAIGSPVVAILAAVTAIAAGSVAIRALWFAAVFIHGFGHTLFKAIVDKDHAFSWTDVVEGTTVREFLTGLIPANEIYTPGLSEKKTMDAGEQTPWKIRVKALGGIVANGVVMTLIALVLPGMADVTIGGFPVSWALNGLMVANSVALLTSFVSDVAAFFSGEADTFSCGWLDYVVPFQAESKGLFPTWVQNAIERSTDVLSGRGTQAMGFVLKARDRKGHVVLIGDRYVNPKRGILHERLSRGIRDVVNEAESRGFERIGSVLDYASHLRFGTSSAPSVGETHPHTSPAMAVTLWDWSNAALGAVERKDNLQISVRHNGDNDGIKKMLEELSAENRFIFLQETSFKEIRKEMNRILYHDSTSGDSPVLASMLTLMTTQGRFDASARLAYLLTVPTSLSEAFPGLTAPSQVELRDEPVG